MTLKFTQCRRKWHDSTGHTQYGTDTLFFYINNTLLIFVPQYAANSMFNSNGGTINLA